jgi:hypothetical protein
MGTMSEFGVLLLLVLAFSVPLLQNIFARFWRQDEDNEKS